MPPPSRRDDSLPSEASAKEGVSSSPQFSPKQYHLIAFIRVDSEDDEPLTYEQACAEKDQQELMCPENIYRIEEIPPP